MPVLHTTSPPDAHARRTLEARGPSREMRVHRMRAQARLLTAPIEGPAGHGRTRGWALGLVAVGALWAVVLTLV